MNSKLRVALFFQLILLQLAIPTSIIVSRENIFRHGRTYLFKTAPVDPYDAFHGRYVQLGFEQSEVTAPEEDHWEEGQKGFLVLQKDAEGFARPVSLERHRPGSDYSYVKVRVQGYWDGKAHFSYPFDRYYMEEHLAKPAEEAYRGARTALNTPNTRTAHVAVKIKDGAAALEELYLDGKPIRESLKF